MTDASIIIPHYNDTLRLQRCLVALMPQMTSSCEIVVVDNGSSESLDPIRQTFPDLRIIVELRKGAAAARNRGVAETRTERLFFLDSDCQPASDWLATALVIAPSADVIGGSVHLFDETPPPRSGAQAFETVFAFDNRRYVESKGFSVTANLLTRREVFASVGPFLPGLSEDLDWCHRATSQGFGLSFAQDLVVSHPSRRDWTALRRKWHRLTVEAFAVNGSSHLARAIWACKALMMLVSIPVHIPKIYKSQQLNFQERNRATLILVRLRLTRMAWMLAQALRRT